MVQLFVVLPLAGRVAQIFRMLKRERLEQILDIELEHVQERIMSPGVTRPFVLKCTMSARDFLLKEGTDARCGARHLKRSIERHLVFPLSNLLATDQIGAGDLVATYYSSKSSKLAFLKEDWGALVGAPGSEHIWSRRGADTRVWRRCQRQ